MAKPAKHLDWTDGDAAKVTEPPTGKKDLGWTAAEKPPAKWFNWLFYIQDQWNKYFEEIADAVLANGTIYDAVVGVGGTHATIPDLLADANIAVKKNILVISPFTLNTTTIFNQDDMNFYFTPKAVTAKGTAAVAFEISANRVRIYGARFQNFNGGSDECLRINNGSDYTMIRDCYFFNFNQSINDQSEKSSLIGNIEEI